MGDDEDKITTIQVKTSTRDRLKEKCKGKETYDDQINRLLKLEEAHA